MVNCDDFYWELRNSIEVACGPASMHKRIKGTGFEDIAVYVNDADKVPSGISVFKVCVTGFSTRAVYIGGLPHLSLEDAIASLPLNDQYYVDLIGNFNLRHVNLSLVLNLAGRAGLINDVKRLLRRYELIE